MDFQSQLARVLRSGSPAVGDLKLGPRKIDTSRPIINNPDGSFSTERTATFEVDGQHVVLPTIVNGKQMQPRAALDEWFKGGNPEVGAFATPGEADAYARQRTAMIGKLRGPR